MEQIYQSSNSSVTYDGTVSVRTTPVKSHDNGKTQTVEVEAFDQDGNVLHTFTVFANEVRIEL
jgi:hypothetical protein